MKKRIYLWSTVIFFLVIAFVVFLNRSNSEQALITKTKQGAFQIDVMVSGELEAKNAININAPEALRTLRIFQVKLADIVPEGTIVKKGDYVASLDKSEIAEKLKDIENELEKAKNQYIQTKLDTSLNLKISKNELDNLYLDLKEKENQLNEKKFEAPVVIRQAELELKKAKIAYEQALKNHEIKHNKAVLKINQAGGSLSDELLKQKELIQLMDEFTILAPQEGMVIYKREWNGEKLQVGGTISAWDPVVATLPDLSKLISRAYVNEVDIDKIKVGQKVIVRVDAFPDKKFEGKVIKIANIGEQNPISSVRVFEVLIEIISKNKVLKPSMTTSNQIIIKNYKNVTYIPISALYAQGDTLHYVYKKRGRKIIKQKVKIGASNATDIIIRKGLKKDDLIYLSSPENSSDYRLVGID